MLCWYCLVKAHAWLVFHLLPYRARIAVLVLTVYKNHGTNPTAPTLIASLVEASFKILLVLHWSPSSIGESSEEDAWQSPHIPVSSIISFLGIPPAIQEARLSSSRGLHPSFGKGLIELDYRVIVPSLLLSGYVLYYNHGNDSWWWWAAYLGRLTMPLLWRAINRHGKTNIMHWRGQSCFLLVDVARCPST